jgi:hypothetical protein
MAQIGTKFSILYFNFFSLTIGQIIKLSINPSVFGREVFRSFQLPQESKAHNPKVAGSNPAPATTPSQVNSTTCGLDHPP